MIIVKFLLIIENYKIKIIEILLYAVKGKKHFFNNLVYSSKDSSKRRITPQVSKKTYNYVATSLHNYTPHYI